MPYCQSATVVKWTPQQKAARVLKCRSWQCADCHPIRRRELIARAIKGRPSIFLTLTVNPKMHETPAKAAAALARAWRLCRQRMMRRHHMKRLPFLAVIERTEAGWPHLHVVLRATWLAQAEISTIMADLIGAPIVHIERVHSGKAIAAYVAKYIGKDPQRIGTTKRYWASTDYDTDWKRRKESSPFFGWSVEIQHEDICNVAKVWSLCGLYVVWHARDYVTAAKDRDKADGPVPIRQPGHAGPVRHSGPQSSAYVK